MNKDPQGFQVGMETGEIHILKHVEWQLFGGLSYRDLRTVVRQGVTYIGKSGVPTETGRVKLWFALSRTVAKWHHVYFPELLWVLRTERGETFGRIHHHFLIGGLPASAIQERTCAAMEAQWRKWTGAKAPVSIYDPSQRGGQYTLKCLGITDPGSSYEAGKFGLGSTDLLIAKSVQKFARVTRDSFSMKKRGLCDGPSEATGDA